MSTTSAGRYVGQSVKRREDPRLLTGHGRYVDDVQQVGTLHVAFVRSDVARGTIVGLDVSDAAALRGVEAVYTGGDLNPLIGQLWSTIMGPPVELGGVTPYPPPSVLAEGDVRFVGDPVAVVIASSRYIAEDAAQLVVVDIDAQPAVLGVHRAAMDEALVHHETTTNVTARVPMPEIPALEEAFASAAHVFTRTFAGARATNVPMEPRGLVVQ
ncbi:MAG: xanthine dehydrogenase family protein molybdopterin-binding subunit, partial [Ilumatobacteraceae bacterium]